MVLDIVIWGSYYSVINKSLYKQYVNNLPVEALDQHRNNRTTALHYDGHIKEVISYVSW